MAKTVPYGGRVQLGRSEPSSTGSKDEKDEKDVESVGSSGDESEYLPNKK